MRFSSLRCATAPALDDPTSRSGPRTTSGAPTCRPRRESAKISPFQENIFNRRKFVRPRNTTSTISVWSARHAACVAVVKSIAPNRHFTRLPHAVGSTAGCTCKGDPFAGRPQRMSRTSHCETKDGARRDPRTLHAIDAIGTRRPAPTSVDAADIDRLSASRISPDATSCDSRITWRRALIEGPGGSSRVAWPTKNTVAFHCIARKTGGWAEPDGSAALSLTRRTSAWMSRSRMSETHRHRRRRVRGRPRAQQSVSPFPSSLVVW